MTDKVVKQLTSKQAYQACRTLHAQIIKHGKTCEANGILPGECGDQLQCAHIVPKKAAPWVAWDLTNGWALCAKHHTMIDYNQARWYVLAEQTQQLMAAKRLLRLQDKGNPCEKRVDFLRDTVADLLFIAESKGIPVVQPNYVLKWRDFYG